jgi:hypothetical protein
VRSVSIGIIQERFCSSRARGSKKTRQMCMFAVVTLPADSSDGYMVLRCWMPEPKKGIWCCVAGRRCCRTTRQACGFAYGFASLTKRAVVSSTHTRGLTVLVSRCMHATQALGMSNDR